MRVLFLIPLVLLASCSADRPAGPYFPYPDPGEEIPAEQLAVPAELQVLELGDTFLQLAWADTSGVGPPAIVVEGRLAGSESFTLWTILVAGTSQWDAPVQPDSSYVFRIAARNEDGHSPFTETVSATALPLHYWNVTGGIHHKAPGYRHVFFRFGRENRFRPSGTLTITGPDGWNDGHTFQRRWGSYYIGLQGDGVATGEYRLTFSSGDRLFAATVQLDADLFLPLPEVQVEVLPGRQVQASWSCTGAEEYGLCWGPQGGAPCLSAGTTTDSLLVAEEEGDIYWLDVSAYTDNLDGQAASSSRFFELDLTDF